MLIFLPKEHIIIRWNGREDVFADASTNQRFYVEVATEEDSNVDM